MSPWVVIFGVFAFVMWWRHRMVDHRWYCGGRHRAHMQCTPTVHYIERQKRRDKRLARAEALEDEARRLRRMTLW